MLKAAYHKFSIIRDMPDENIYYPL